MDTFFITTAIDYPNGPPHIGHAYEKVLADVFARYHRLLSEKVFFLTGVDQHGQKMVKTADEEGVNVATLTKRNTKKFIALWEKLDLSNDSFAETTDERHKRCVQAILSDLHERGQLYKKAYQGHYSVRQEQYLTERDRNEEGEFGPEWGEVIELEEENWYFKLSEHAEWLKEAVSNNTFGILPEFKRVEVLNAAERAGETDLCISRPKKRLHWGIEFPFDPDYVTYVWFDALINYVSFAGYLKEEGSDLPDFDTLWPANAQVIGKDILVPAHSIYWPCMLRGMGFSDEQMPTLLVHGWWNMKDGKISKSVGNVVDPNELIDLFGVDAVRYYLVRDIVMGKDSTYDVDRLILLYNTELANDLGNLLNRSLTMIKRFGGAEIREASYSDEMLVALQDSLAKTRSDYFAAMDNFDVPTALKAVSAHVSQCNRLVDDTEPFRLAKDESQAERVAAILGHLCESCAQLAILLSPVLPQASARVLSQLRAEDLVPKDIRTLEWGLLPVGHTTGKPKPVFPRYQVEEEEGSA